jgi:hypothetical protein
MNRTFGRLAADARPARVVRSRIRERMIKEELK